MASVFKDQQDYGTPVHHNVFDRSHQNNLTTKIGDLTPVFCQEVLPGDSISIDPTFGLRFMPMKFPIQTRMRAKLHFYYVRNRSLWKDWQDFIYSTKKNLSMPYIGQNTPVSFQTGSIMDYMGFPTQFISHGEKLQYFDYHTAVGYADDGADNYALPMFRKAPVNGETFNQFFGEIPAGARFYPYVEIRNPNFSGGLTECVVKIDNDKAWDTFHGKEIKFFFVDQDDKIHTDTAFVSQWKWLPEERTFSFTIKSHLLTPHNRIIAYAQLQQIGLPNTLSDVKFTYSTLSSYYGTINTNIDGSLYNPVKTGHMRVNALPFRAYESIYNFYYRNTQNDPFKIDGEIEYNKFVTTSEGGEDTTRYEIEQHNWELDQFTSALPSPQADGILPPLVGVTQNGQIAFRDEEGTIRNVHVKDYIDDENEKSVKGIELTSSLDKEAQIIPFNEMTQYGITIEDFRFVNSVQKFLEIKLRQGFKYKDLTKGYYNVDIRFDELNIPEFIGGVNQNVNVNSISSTAQTEDANLGDYAGQATCIGQSKHRISKRFDEAGFVIGILCVVPNPVYTQSIPKHLLKFEALDYYFPQFANIGYQAISKEELAPTQWFNQLRSSDNPDKEPTFGYQRAWYDYVHTNDTAHGAFRNTLSNFLMHRQFNGVPTLGKEFLKINQGQISDVFNFTEATNHTILGELYFDVKYKTTVPYKSIPSLD